MVVILFFFFVIKREEVVVIVGILKIFEIFVCWGKIWCCGGYFFRGKEWYVRV